MSTRILPTGSPRPRPIPPLHNGDRLGADEYLIRYRAMPEEVKAELIEGVVYMASPVSTFHGNPHADMVWWLGAYRLATPGTLVADNTTAQLDPRNVPQPDAALYVAPAFGGTVTISDEGYIQGAPELVVEIAASSASYDLGPKMTTYARNGVREYVVLRTFDDAIDWFVLRSAAYDPLPPGPDGVHRSEVFPGLRLDGAALLVGDIAQMNAALQQGLQSPEHARFVTELQARLSS
jgi:Uma2 family endonuclease